MMNAMHPLVVDRTVLWGLSITYGLYAAWGLAAFITGIVPIRDLSGEGVEALWGALIFLLSGALSWAVLSRRERWEAPLTTGWVVIAALYPIALIFRFFQGTLDAPHVIFIAVAYLVIPAFRLVFLVRKGSVR